MKSLKHRAGRGLAAGVVGVLVAGTISVMATPTQAAQAPVATAATASTGGAFTWGVSDQVAARFGTWTPSDGASVTDKVASFPQESLVVEADGDTVVQYGGQLVTSFVFDGNVLYSTTIADPAVTVAADGSGVLTAVVSGFQDFEPQYPHQQTSPARVTVGEFNATGDLRSGLTGTLAGFADGFVGQQADGVKPHFDGSTEVKQPAPFTASVGAPTVSATLSADKSFVTVSGTNFIGGDENYAGVYVGLAPSGGQPDTSTQAGQDLYAGENWVTPGNVVNGAFTIGFEVKSDKIIAGREYSVYTWQAHKHTTDALDTETRMGVLKAAPPKATKKTPTIGIKIKKKATRKAAGRAVVTVRGTAGRPTGRIVVKLKRPGVKKVRTVRAKLNKKGKATIRLAKARKKGAYRVTVRYLGNKKYTKQRKVVRFRVKR